jgi:hypothetical protein
MDHVRHSEDLELRGTSSRGVAIRDSAVGLSSKSVASLIVRTKRA